MIKSSNVTRLIYFVWFGALSVVFVRGLDTLLLSLRWPLSISLDASILRFESWSWMQGQMPWTDILSLNLPLTHYIHMLGLVLFGADDLGFRLLDGAWLLILASTTFLTLRSFSLPAALTGMALAFTLVAEATPFGAFQRETLMLPFWLLALASSIKLQESSLPESANRALWILGALAICAACWIKPTSLALGLLFIQPLKRSSLRDRIRGVSFGVCAVLIFSFMVILPLSLSGKLFPAIQSWWSLNATYASWEARPILPLIGDLFTLRPDKWMLPINVPIRDVGDTGHLTLFHILLLISFVWLRRDRNTIQILLFLLAGLFTYAAQRRGFQYHVYPLWHGFNLVGAIVAGDLLRRLTGMFQGEKPTVPAKLELVSIILLFFILPTSWIVRQTNSYHAYVGTGLLSKKATSRIPEFEIVGAVANRVEQLRGSNANKVIRYQVIEDASIALGAVIRCNLRYATRFPVDYLFFTDTPFRESFKAEFIGSLEREKPDIVVYSVGFPGEAKARRIDTFPQLKHLLETYYDREVVKERHGTEYYLYTLRR
ncbi:MAG: hypothetical protein JNM27_10095 [Leptospirales bacterium]|nr:hypothetical protein [Leptospirales bacterium]